MVAMYHSLFLSRSNYQSLLLSRSNFPLLNLSSSHKLTLSIWSNNSPYSSHFLGTHLTAFSDIHLCNSLIVWLTVLVNQHKLFSVCILCFISGDDLKDKFTDCFYCWWIISVVQGWHVSYHIHHCDDHTEYFVLPTLCIHQFYHF